MTLRLALLLAVTLPALPAPAAEPSPDTRQLYEKKCASCHGDDGKAETKLGQKYKAKSFASSAFQAKASDQKLLDAIENGVQDTKMHPFKDKLSPDEIKAMVQMVRSFGPK